MIHLCLWFYNSRRLRSVIKRAAVLHPQFVPWQQLYPYGNDSSFLCITGMTRPAFVELLEISFDDEVCIRRGRIFSLDNPGKLGLSLVYCSSAMPTKHFCLIFGTTLSATKRYISIMREIVKSKLQHHVKARIRFPGVLEMEDMQHLSV